MKNASKPFVVGGKEIKPTYELNTEVEESKHMDVPLMTKHTDVPLMTKHTDVPLMTKHTDVPLMMKHTDVPLMTKLETPEDMHKPLIIKMKENTIELGKECTFEKKSEKNFIAAKALKNVLEKQKLELELQSSTENEKYGNFELELLEKTRRIYDTQSGEMAQLYYKFRIWVDGNSYVARISALDVEKISWIPRATGGYARFAANKNAKSTVLKIIQTQVENAIVPEYTVYERNGWKKIGEKLFYVIHSGAVGRPDLLVRGDSQHQFQYDMKQVGTEKIFRETFQIFQITRSKEVALLLFLFTHQSLLAHFFELVGFPIKYVMALIGPTNSRKTSMALCMTKIFNRDQIHTPELSFESTVGGIEVACSMHNDVPILIDDFHPACSKAKAKELESKLEFVLRRYGDRVAKKRMTAFMTSPGKAYFPVRGGCIITGEDISGVQSSLTRTVVLKVDKTDVQNDILTFYQDNREILPTYFYDFISYITEIQESLISMLAERVKRIRAEKKYFIARYAEIHAQFLTIAEIIAKYALYRNFWKIEQVEEWMSYCEDSILHVLHENEKLVKTSDLATMSLQALAESMQKNNVIDLDHVNPENPTGILYENSEYIFIQTKDLMQIMQAYWKKMGTDLPFSSTRQLMNFLAEHEVIMIKTTPSGIRRSHTLPGTTKIKTRFLFIKKSRMEELLEEAENV